MCGLRYTRKTTMSFFFLFHKITNKRSLQPQHMIFFLKLKLSPFHLKEALYDSSLAYPSCQHHYSCTLGALLSKIKVTWTQALKYHDRPSDNQDDVKWLMGRTCWTKWWFMSRAGWGRLVRENGMQFKTYELFISGIFHLIFLDCGWLWVTEIVESKTVAKQGLLYF